MRNRIAALLLFALTLSLIGIVLIQDHYNSELLQQIEAKQQLLVDISRRDSIYSQKTKEYSDVITRYVNNCQFSINGKVVTTDELLEIVNESWDENQTLSDSLAIYKSIVDALQRRLNESQSNYYKYRDSTSIYRSAFNATKRDYGVDYQIVETDKGRNLVRNFSKSDSALILYPFYKNKLRYDSISGKWIVTTEKLEITTPVESIKKRRDK